MTSSELSYKKIKEIGRQIVESRYALARELAASIVTNTSEDLKAKERSGKSYQAVRLVGRIWRTQKNPTAITYITLLEDGLTAAPKSGTEGMIQVLLPLDSPCSANELNHTRGLRKALRVKDLLSVIGVPATRKGKTPCVICSHLQLLTGESDRDRSAIATY
mmetsp:Transcript_15280/g.21268  ORF Transcript_15280/g.21268 Transcript_15280/m.21268 type:complete len:162 (+) Transcript_15280:74-559(+)